ncbi:MAG: TonB-dependent receptor [Acinetobacter sp.]|nr:MAG: TonB-dependent receptor [Acinetobacter sp.]
MSKFFQLASLASAITVVLTATTSHADTQPIIQLETIVVTAAKSPQNIEHVPARVTVIDEATLKQSPIASLPHVLQQEAAINMVQTGGYGQQSSIFLRGTNSNQTLVLRDGVRLNTATTGATNLQFIDTTDLKQIEILKGAASVLYGTDAIGGVIQLISKNPEKTSAFITGEAGENSTYKAVIGADLAENGVYAQVRAQRLETDGTQVTDFKQNNLKTADYDQKGFSAKFGVEQTQYALSLDYAQNDGRSTYVTGDFDPTTYAFIGFKNLSQDFNNEVVNFKGRVNLNDNVVMNARASQFKDDIDQHNSSDFIHSTTQEFDVNSQWKFSPEQNILLGITQQKIKGDVLSFGSPYQGDVDSTGYYVQHQYHANGLNTQVGLRIEDNEKYGTHTVGQVAARYQILPLTSVYANVGTAFKAPTLNDMYGYGGNVDLKPEESVSYEIGLDQKLNYGLSTGVSAYQTKVKHLISNECVATCNGDWVTTFPVYQNINNEKSTFTGGEVYLNWQMQDLFVKSTYSYVKAEYDHSSKEFLRRPHQSVSLSTGLANDIYGVSAALSAKSSAKDVQQDVAGYATVDLNAYWNILPQVKVFANVENVGDTQYKTASYQAGTYYINGGRLASAGMTFRY